MDTPTESELWTLAQYRSQCAAKTLAGLGVGCIPPDRKLNELRRSLNDMRAATCAAQEIENRLRNGRTGV
jgi:hypothetical protein